MIKIKVENYKEHKKKILQLLKTTPEATVKENSFFKTDAVLEANVERLYSEFFFKNVISEVLNKFATISRHKKVDVVSFYKASLLLNNYIEWHVSSNRGQYECFFAADTKGIDINYYDNKLCQNKTIELNEGETIFIPTHIPRAIEIIKNKTKLIIFYLNLNEYFHEK